MKAFRLSLVSKLLAAVTVLAAGPLVELARAGEKARGGDIIGDGADIVYCEDSSGRKWTSLLDFDEGAYRYGYQIELGEPASSPVDQALLALEKLEKKAPRGAVELSWLRTRIESFDSEIRWIPEDEGRQDDDRGDAVWTPNCDRERLIMRFDSLTPRGARYAIEKSRWDDLPEAHRGGAIVHEAIYGYAEEILKQATSEHSRHLNALLHSKEFERMTWNEFLKVATKMGFCEGDVCFSRLDSRKAHFRSEVISSTRSSALAR